MTTLSCRRATRATGAAAQLRVAASRFDFCFDSPIEVFVQSLRACNQYSAKASTFQLAHQDSILVCLPVRLSGCFPKRCFFLLSLYFIYFFFKSIASGVMGFAFVPLAVRPPGRHDNLCTFFPAVLLSFFFVSWSVNKVQAEGRNKKCEKSKTSKSRTARQFRV